MPSLTTNNVKEVRNVSSTIAQITAALSEYPSSSLHIVCHSEPETLYLGKTPFNWSNLEQYRHQLQRWQGSFQVKVEKVA